MKLQYLIVAVAAAVLGVAALAGALREVDRAAAWPQPKPISPIVTLGDDESDDEDEGQDENVVEFAETAVFFEFNATDADLGIQIFFDGPGWEEVEVVGPDGLIFEVENGGGLSEIGSTEVFTESAEPPLDEDALAEEIAEFLAMFPAGEYAFAGHTVEGYALVGEATLTHDLPAMVSLDLEDFPVIAWTPGPGGPEIVGYEVIAEMVVEDDDEERVFVSTANFPAGVEQMEVPEAFVELAEDFEDAGVLLELKVEVIAIEASGNKTITEQALFEMDEEP